MTEHRDGAALLDLERMGLSVHRSQSSHEHLGNEHLAQATVLLGIFPDAEPTMSVLVDDRSAQRLLPLDAFQAEGLLAELGNQGARFSEHMGRMLAHLLVRLSEIYRQLDLTRLVVSPLHLSEAGYCIDGALLQFAHQPIHSGIDFQFRQGRDHVVELPRHGR